MGNDAARDGLADVLANLQEQLADIAAMQKKQAALRVTGQAADGAVEVTVDARGQLVKAVVDESYLDDHDVEELGEDIVEAAQAAVKEAAGRVAAMWAPIGERHRLFPSFSDIVEGVPDLKDLLPPGLDAFPAAARRREDRSVLSAGGIDDGEERGEFFTVRR